MNSVSSLVSLLAFGALLLGAPALAQNDHRSPAAQGDASNARGQLVKITEKEAAWAAKERAGYPLKTCVVSDEELGSMGESPEFIYRVAGQPDRLVIFCCQGCSEDFLHDPAAHLAKIDATKAKPSGK